MIALHPNERIICEARKHWYVVLYYVLLCVGLSLVPILFVALFSSLPLELSFDGNISYLILFFYSIWLLLLWIFFFSMWTDYYFDVWYITNERIIDVEQVGFFHREIATIGLEQVEDITTVMSGVVQTYFGAGELRIQSAGEKMEFSIRNAKNVDKLKDIIWNAHNTLIKAGL
jgi:hypothetical protein